MTSTFILFFIIYILIQQKIKNDYFNRRKRFKTNTQN